MQIGGFQGLEGRGEWEAIAEWIWDRFEVINHFATR